ncbi:MAG: YkvA family protein [Rubrivivax sp.]|nr:YkvA family protein [Rubrivivax sp.]
MLKRLALLWTVIRGDARLLWLALKHPLAPGWLKPAVALMLLYVLSPVDFIPDFIPLLGVVDDVVMVPLAIRFILKRLPAQLRADIEGRVVA